MIQVSISDGPALAESYHVPHYQVSAAESDVNIKSAMHSLIRQLLLRSSVIPSTFLPIASITKMLSSLLSKSNRPTKEVKSVSSFSLVSPTSSPEHSKLLITNNRHKIAIHKKLGLHSFNLLESRRSRWLSGREHKGAMKSLLLNWMESLRLPLVDRASSICALNTPLPRNNEGNKIIWEEISSGRGDNRSDPGTVME